MEIRFQCWDCQLYRGNYSSQIGNATALFLRDAETGEPIATVSKHFPGQLKLNEIAYDTNNLGHELFVELVKKGIMKPTGKLIQSGFCEYPVFLVNVEKVPEFEI